MHRIEHKFLPAAEVHHEQVLQSRSSGRQRGDVWLDENEIKCARPPLTGV